MTRQRFIGVAMNRADSYLRNIHLATAKWAERHPDWSLVALNPNFDRNTLEALKNMDAAIMAVNSSDLRQMLVDRIMESELVFLDKFQDGRLPNRDGQ